MITDVPTLENKSLYEVIRLTGCDGLDISDETYDWGIYADCQMSFKECHDYYDNFMLLFCLNVNVVKVNSEWYTICNVTKFIKDNIEPINKFMNEENREGYRPMDYKDIDDELFYDLYMTTFEQLIAGNYCDSDYEKLYKYLGGK